MWHCVAADVSFYKTRHSDEGNDRELVVKGEHISRIE